MKSIYGKKSLTRRNFIVIGSTVAASAILFNQLCWSDENTADFVKPQAHGQKNPQLNESEFLKLSQYLLNENELDKDFSNKIYKFLKQNKNEIYRFYEFIRLHPNNDSSLVRKYLKENKKFQMIYSQIAISWYTGVLTIGKSAIRFSYFDAYMFKQIGGLAPIPGTCGGATDYWSEKPSI